MNRVGRSGDAQVSLLALVGSKWHWLKSQSSLYVTFVTSRTA